MKRALTILRLLALRPVLGQCLLAGVMFALAFPCHPDHVLAPLFHPVWGWVALIPLLLATHAAPTSASAFRRGWFAGWVGFLLCLYWVGYTAGGGPAVIAGAGLGALYLALFTGLFAVAHHRLAVHFGHRALVAVPVLWTAMEYLMSLGEMGFPWLLMGHSQANQPVLIQLASLTGAFRDPRGLLYEPRGRWGFDTKVERPVLKGNDVDWDRYFSIFVPFCRPIVELFTKFYHVDPQGSQGLSYRRRRLCRPGQHPQACHPFDNLRHTNGREGGW